MWEQLSASPSAIVMIDGRFILAERDLTLQFRGSRNQRLIDMPATRSAGHVVLKKFSDFEKRKFQKKPSKEEWSFIRVIQFATPSDDRKVICKVI